MRGWFVFFMCVVPAAGDTLTVPVGGAVDVVEIIHGVTGGGVLLLAERSCGQRQDSLLGDRGVSFRADVSSVVIEPENVHKWVPPGFSIFESGFSEVDLIPGELRVDQLCNFIGGI